MNPEKISLYYKTRSFQFFNIRKRCLITTHRLLHPSSSVFDFLKGTLSVYGMWPWFRPSKSQNLHCYCNVSSHYVIYIEVGNQMVSPLMATTRGPHICTHANRLKKPRSIFHFTCKQICNQGYFPFYTFPEVFSILHANRSAIRDIFHFTQSQRHDMVEDRSASEGVFC